jgi:hypothetical protein
VAGLLCHTVRDTAGGLSSSAAFAKLRKAIVSFVIHVCLSVRMEQLDSHWTVFH